MARIGLLTRSDGHDFVAADIDTFCRSAKASLAGALRAAATG